MHYHSKTARRPPTYRPRILARCSARVHCNSILVASPMVSPVFYKEVKSPCSCGHLDLLVPPRCCSSSIFVNFAILVFTPPFTTFYVPSLCHTFPLPVPCSIDSFVSTSLWHLIASPLTPFVSTSISVSFLLSFIFASPFMLLFLPRTDPWRLVLHEYTALGRHFHPPLTSVNSLVVRPNTGHSKGRPRPRFS